MYREAVKIIISCCLLGEILETGRDFDQYATRCGNVHAVYIEIALSLASISDFIKKVHSVTRSYDLFLRDAYVCRIICVDPRDEIKDALSL